MSALPVITVTDNRDKAGYVRNRDGRCLYAHPDKGYLVLNADGSLREPVLYLVIEQARKVAGNDGRVVNRSWYERTARCRIRTAKPEVANV
jgi:hypothetical protein